MEIGSHVINFCLLRYCVSCECVSDNIFNVNAYIFPMVCYLLMAICNFKAYSLFVLRFWCMCVCLYMFYILG